MRESRRDRYGIRVHTLKRITLYNHPRTALSSLADRRGGNARFAEREAKPRGEGWRDMRLSRNRGNARGPTRLTNPLHRATSCRTHAFARSLAHSLARLATKPSLAVYSSFPFSRQRETLFFSLRLSAIPPTFSSFLEIFLPPSCLFPLAPIPPSFPSSSIHPVLPPYARCILSTFPSSTIHPPLYSSSATPSSLYLLSRLLFCLCPPLYVPRSPPLAPIEYHPSQCARSILPYPPLISSSANTIGHLHQLHTRGWNVPCHLCYRITPGLFRSQWYQSLRFPQGVLSNVIEIL